MSRKFKVAVILINYNSSSHTINCLKSIYELTPSKLSFQTIVVDNNSEPDDFNQLLKHNEFPNLEIIRSKINTGFATGCMQGVQYAEADYYFFLNNDCIIINDCLSILTEFMDGTPSATICSPQLHNADGKPTSSFNYRPDLLSKILGNYVFKFSRGPAYVHRKKVPIKPVQVEVLSGSQLFVRAVDFESIGGFDTTLFLYCEEEDLAYRAYKAGMQLWLIPDAKNSHIGGASTKPSLAIRKEFLISFFYFYEKHYGKAKTIALRLIYALRYSRKSLRDLNNLRLVWFILSGSHMKFSLRHQQRISTPSSEFH